MTNFMVKSGSDTSSGQISQKQIWYSPSKMAIQGHAFWGQGKGDTGLNNTI